MVALDNYGLQDFAVKTKMKPAPGWTFKADYHNFRTDTDISGGDANTLIAVRPVDLLLPWILIWVLKWI